MSLIKHLLEMSAELDEHLFSNVYDHVKGRLRYESSERIEDMINDWLDENGETLSDEEVRALNHAVRERLHGDRMRTSAAVQK